MNFFRQRQPRKNAVSHESGQALVEYLLVTLLLVTVALFTHSRLEEAWLAFYERASGVIALPLP